MTALRIDRALVAAAIMIAAVAVSATVLPIGTIAEGSTQLDYRIHLNDYTKGPEVASMHQSFERSGAKYRMSSEARAQGLLALVWRGEMVQLSQGGLTEQGLAPERFEDRRGKRAPRGAIVDRAAGTVSFNGGAPVAAPAGLQDRLSAFVQLGLQLAAASPQGALPAVGWQTEFPLLATSSIDPARWQLQGSESLTIHGSDVATVRLERLVQQEGDAVRIEAWYAPQRLPFPVRMRVADADGQVLDQILSAAR